MPFYPCQRHKTRASGNTNICGNWTFVNAFLLLLCCWCNVQSISMVRFVIFADNFAWNWMGWPYDYKPIANQPLAHKWPLPNNGSSCVRLIKRQKNVRPSIIRDTPWTVLHVCWTVANTSQAGCRSKRRRSGSWALCAVEFIAFFRMRISIIAAYLMNSRMKRICAIDSHILSPSIR